MIIFSVPANVIAIMLFYKAKVSMLEIALLYKLHTVRSLHITWYLIADTTMLAETCEPVRCRLGCPNGFATNEKGCEICKCSK